MMSVKDLSSLELVGDLGMLEVGGKKLPIKELFEINEFDLDKEYREQSALYAYFVSAFSEAERDHAAAVSHKELVIADCDEYYREKFLSDGRKVTENVIKSAIIQDDEYGRAIDREISAKHYYSTLKGIVKAMELRAEMLRSLGAKMRSEYEMTNMTVRSKNYDDSIQEFKTNLRKKPQKR